MVRMRALQGSICMRSYRWILQAHEDWKKPKKKENTMFVSGVVV